MHEVIEPVPRHAAERAAHRHEKPDHVWRLCPTTATQNEAPGFRLRMKLRRTAVALAKAVKPGDRLENVCYGGKLIGGTLVELLGRMP